MVRIALGQLNTTVGDLDGNAQRIADAAARATAAGADAIVLPELAITGYPPEDLVLRRAFVDDTLAAVDALAQATAAGCDVIVGFVDRSAAGVHNAAAVLQGGAVTARYAKCKLPNYGVFDERRTFVAGTEGVTVEVAGIDVGLSICEDAWEPGPPFDRYVGTPIVANLNGSPFHRGKVEERADVLRARAAETGAWIVYVNAVGGQDELVFDGGSLVVAPDGSVACRAARFDEDLLVVQIDDDGFAAEQRPPWPASPRRCIARSCSARATTFARTGFRRSCSGSPAGSTRRSWPRSPWTRWAPMPCTPWRCPACTRARAASTDAEDVAGRLGIRLETVAITDVFRAYEKQLADLHAVEGLAAENLQARIRGNDLMALSNRFGWLVLATGNKSEYAVGYSTLYGDMAGGFAPVKDVPKTLLYELCDVAQHGGAGAAYPRLDPDEAALGGAPPRPAGHRLPSPVRGAGPDHRRLCRRRPRDRRDRRGGHR